MDVRVGPLRRLNAEELMSIESKLRFFPGVMYGCESWTIKKAEC